MSKHIGFCPICYDDLRNKCVASPDVCEHTFCFDCLQKSSKLGRFCPVDRKRYRKIINLKSGKSFQVKPCRRKKERVLYDISVYCEICSKSSEGEKLLLCDCCDLGYHCKCLSPPLKSIPSGQWFCPECLAVEEKMKKSRGITKEAECSGTQAGYSNFQGKESTVPKELQGNSTENRYMLEEKKNATKNKTKGSSAENRYLFRERSKRKISETESINRDYFSEEGAGELKTESERLKQCGNEFFSPGSEKERKEQCSDNAVLDGNHIKPEELKMEFKKNNFGEAKVIVEKVDLHNFLPPSTSTQKEINLEKVAVTKPKIPFEKTKDFENSDSSHLSNKLKSLELQKFSVFEKVDDMTISKQKCSTIKSLSSEISQKSLSNGISHLGSIPNLVHQEKHTIFGKSSQLASERKKFLTPCVHIKDFKLSTITNVHATCRNMQCVQCNSFISSLSTSLKDIKKHKTIGGTNQNSLYHKNTSHSMVQNNKAVTKSLELQKFSVFEKVDDMTISNQKCSTIKSLSSEISQKSLSNGISNFGSIPNPVHQEKHTIFGKSSQVANERKKFLAPCVHIKDFKLSTISNVHATCQNVQCVQCDSFISSLSTSLKDIKKHKTIGGTNQNSLYHKYTSHTMVQNNKAATKATISSKELKKIKKEKKVKHWQSAKLKYRCDAYKTLIEYLS